MPLDMLLPGRILLPLRSWTRTDDEVDTETGKGELEAEEDERGGTWVGGTELIPEPVFKGPGD